ncbi:hypothetical protein HN873_065178 [Arachis hypogaea]
MLKASFLLPPSSLLSKHKTNTTERVRFLLLRDSHQCRMCDCINRTDFSRKLRPWSIAVVISFTELGRLISLTQEPTHPAIPILLAVGTVHQHLIQNGLRMLASIVADIAQCFSTHQFACLIGYGASAVCPYLALETCRQWRLSNKTVNLMRNGKMPIASIEQAQNNYTKAVKAGLLKELKGPKKIVFSCVLILFLP